MLFRSEAVEDGHAQATDVVIELLAVLRDMTETTDAADAISNLLGVLEPRDQSSSIEVSVWGDTESDTAVDTRPRSQDRLVDPDDRQFEEAFVAFWNALPVPTRHAMAAHRRAGAPLTLDLAGDRAEPELRADGDPAAEPVDAGTVAVDSATDVPARRSRVRARRRTTETALLPTPATIARGLRPVVGMLAAIVLSMAVIG